MFFEYMASFEEISRNQKMKKCVCSRVGVCTCVCVCVCLSYFLGWRRPFVSACTYIKYIFLNLISSSFMRNHQKVLLRDGG